MRIKAFIISLLLLLATPLLRAGEKLPFVMGKVYDEQGRPMSAVIVEQVGTSAYAVTARDGWFNLSLEPRRRPKISIRFIGYHTLTLDVEDTDSMVIHMIPLSEEYSEQDPLGLPAVNGFSLYLGYSFFGATFDGYTEMPISFIEQFNRHRHNASFGLSATLRNVYVQLGFGVNPMRRYMAETYRSLTDSYHITFNVGYTLGLYRTNVIMFTPYIGVTHLSYQHYLAPLEKHISLDEYLKQGYMNLYMLQYVGRLGGTFDFKLWQIGRTRHNLYASLGIGYNFKLHRRAHISSVSTKIKSDNGMRIYPLYLEASVRWMLTGKRLAK